MKKQENKAVSGILNQQQRTEQDNRKKVPFSVIIFPGSNGLFCVFSPLSRSFTDDFFETAVKITGIIEAATVCNFL